MKEKVLRLILSVLFATLFLWLIFRQIDISDLMSAVEGASASRISVAVVAFLFGYASRIERWRLMLLGDNPGLRWKDCAGPFMASISVNNVVPFRAGDILRAVGFSGKLNISVATSVTSLLVERLLDLLMLVSFLGVALVYFRKDSVQLVGVGGGVLVVFGIGIVFVLLFPAFFRPLAFGFSRLASAVSSRFGEILFQGFEKAFSALEHTSSIATMLKLIAWSVCAWLFEGFVFWFVALALPSVAHDIAAWLALSVGTLATVIPSTPGYVGTFDYFTSQAMTLLGNSAPASAAYAFLVHFVLWLPPTIIGGVYLLLNPVEVNLWENRYGK